MTSSFPFQNFSSSSLPLGNVSYDPWITPFLIFFPNQFWTINFYNNTITYLAFIIYSKFMNIWISKYSCTYIHIYDKFVHIYTYTHINTQWKPTGLLTQHSFSSNHVPYQHHHQRNKHFIQSDSFHWPELIGLGLISMDKVNLQAPPGNFKICKSIKSISLY